MLAQTLTGRVLEEGRGAPVPGAAVFMIDQDGARRNEATSDSLGRFVIELPEDIEFFLQVEGLGYDTARTPQFSSGSGTPPEIEIMVWAISLIAQARIHDAAAHPTGGTSCSPPYF